LSGDEIIGETSDPRGARVVLSERIWSDKVLDDHAEMAMFLGEVLTAVSRPDHAAVDPLRQRRVRYYRRDVGPSRWLLVVVTYEQEPARIISAFATRKDPPTWSG
jgi:hypothetical protein